MIQLGGRPCIIFSFSLVYREIGKANKNVSDGNLQQSLCRQAFVWRISYYEWFEKKKDALLPLLFNFALEYAIKGFQVKQDGLKLNGTHNLLVCLMMFIYREETYILLRQKRSSNSC